MGAPSDPRGGPPAPSIFVSTLVSSGTSSVVSFVSFCLVVSSTGGPGLPPSSRKFAGLAPSFPRPSSREEQSGGLGGAGPSAGSLGLRISSPTREFASSACEFASSA
eukprot:96466-Prorocentrum_minimum.AAC.1